MRRSSRLLLLSGLVSFAPDAWSQPLAFDRGASGLWHKLVKLSTTASVLHITAPLRRACLSQLDAARDPVAVLVLAARFLVGAV